MAGILVGVSSTYDVGPCLVDYLCSLPGPLWPARHPRENWPTGTKGTGSKSGMMCGREWAQVVLEKKAMGSEEVKRLPPPPEASFSLLSKVWLGRKVSQSTLRINGVALGSGEGRQLL